MTPSSSKDTKKSRRIRRGIAAIVIAAAGIGGVVAGPLGGVSHADTKSAPVETKSADNQPQAFGGIFW